MAAAGFSTTVIGFDWPSGEIPVGYLEDCGDATATCFRLVNDGIRLLTSTRQSDCDVNIHVIAHSMGAYVVREGFKQADNSSIDKTWTANQLVLVSGDISSASMGRDRDDSMSIYRHCGRLTNYYSRHDAVLQVSNVKRLGVSSRVGGSVYLRRHHRLQSMWMHRTDLRSWTIPMSLGADQAGPTTGGSAIRFGIKTWRRP